MIRKILLALLVILIVLSLYNLELIAYGAKQGVGQLKIIWNAQPIEEVKKNPQIPDSIKQSLAYIRDVVDFGVTEIGLEDEGNYQTYYDQKGLPLLFVVTGAKPYALEPYEWTFPVVGKMPYKGFFDPDDADKELARLQSEGYDAYIRNPGGWSTLGWFNDPVLSEMLSRSRGNLANTILHELTHATIFVKDSIEYNENLATFIGDKATLLYLEKRFGKDSEQWINYINEEDDYNKFVNHILRGASKLDSLYKGMEFADIESKKKKKDLMIKSIMANTDTVSFTNPQRFRWNEGVVPNNAYFMSFLRYQSRQGNFGQILAKDFNNELKDYVDHLKKIYN